MINPTQPRLSIVRQCEIVSIGRSSFYREPAPVAEETLRLMRLIDEQFLEMPWYSSRQMARHLRRQGVDLPGRGVGGGSGIGALCGGSP
jgi:putative transposase